KQPGTPVFGQRRGEWVEQPIEVGSRLGRARQVEEHLHAIPKRVRVQHEARARHDVGPVACFVLLQQMEPLVLLREKPARGALYVFAMAAQETSRKARAIEKLGAEQPP